MPHSFAAQVGQVIFLAIVGLSAVKGGRVERVAAATLMIQLVVCSEWGHAFGANAADGLAAFDTAVLVVFAILAFKTDRRWTLWATAFQLLAVLTSSASRLDPTLHLWAYVTTAIIWGYGVLGALAIGTLQVIIGHRRLTTELAAAWRAELIRK